MFTEEEWLGKSLEGYIRKKKDGTVVHRKGLDDQEKLFALQLQFNTFSGLVKEQSQMQADFLKGL